MNTVRPASGAATNADGDMLQLVCTPKPRTQVHTGRAGGNHWWRRDVFHIEHSAGAQTLCGIDSRNWIRIEKRTKADATQDQHLCSRCRRHFSKQNANEAG